ncbi:MAG: Rhs element Vgr protein [Frankiales bacterium]|nr:Rhs element Vgr protein [Frankiales bacterium]
MVVSAAPGTELGHSPAVTVAGAPLRAEVESRLESVVVDLAVALPASATLRFRDPDLDALQAAGLRIGSPVSVSLNRLGTPRAAKVFTGEVTALEYEYDARGSAVVARCHDALHRLTRGRRTRSWTRTDDAAVARAVLSAAGLVPGTVEGSDLRHDHVAQLDVSDWEFLSARAREAGRVLVLSEGKVHVRARPAAAVGRPVPLVVGRDLERLRVRVSSAGQVPAVTADGWDPATQRPVTGRAPAQGTAARTGVAHGTLSAPFRPPPLHAGSPVLGTTAEAAAHAKGLAVRLSDVHAELEGVCGGDPRLLPGVAVEIGGTGPTHDGRYVLTRVQHVSDRDGYRTRVECGGGEDRTLRGLVGAARSTPTGGGNRPVPGVTVGVVTDLKDPTKKGRVKVTFPWLSGEYATDWARVSAPGAGPDRGVAWLPEVNDEVLVAFDHGDTRTPYVLGGLWSARAAPPLGPTLVDGTGRTAVRALRSRTGQRLVLSDEVGRSGATLATGDDKLTVSLDGARTTLTLDSKGAVVISGATDVTVQAGARLVLEGKAGVAIKGATVQIDAQGPVSVTGAVIRLN